MILRPLEPAPPVDEKFVPLWPVVERTQREEHPICWLITQPSHAALAGEIAGRLSAPHLHGLDPELIQAIALHDAGWGIMDAQAIVQSRSSLQHKPESFLAAGVTEFLAAWDKSIVVAESVCAAGGYIVSRHFQRLAQHDLQRPGEQDQRFAEQVERLAKQDERLAEQDERLAEQNERLAKQSARTPPHVQPAREQLRKFLEREAHRQQKLAARQQRSTEELERLTDVLQFCDLLSLYICAGARENVELPEYFGVTARLSVTHDGYGLEPPLVEHGSRFSVAALRHPATKEVSGQQIEVQFV
jgi:hypothetical protein